MKLRTWTLSGAMAGALVLIAGTALADDPMANTYGNTVNTVEKDNGAKGKMMFNQDGTYSVSGTDAKGNPVGYNGHWTLKDGDMTICMTPDAPPDAKSAPPAACAPIEKHNVGDSWTVTNDQKQTYDVSISAGR